MAGEIRLTRYHRNRVQAKQPEPQERGIRAHEKQLMKRCARCHRKLGLGARARNVWNGRWWVHMKRSNATLTHAVGAPFSLAAMRRADSSPHCIDELSTTAR